MINRTFDELVARCGLSPMFASHVMARTIAREHALPEQLRPEDLIRIIPAVERAIRPFLRPDEADRVIASLHLWIGGLLRDSRMPVSAHTRRAEHAG
jgi:uncharacterized protein (DUF2267 family)